KGDVDDAVDQGQGGALVFAQGIEAQSSVGGGGIAPGAATAHGDVGIVRVAAVRAADRGIADDRRSERVGSGGGGQGVEPLHVRGGTTDRLLGLGHDVHDVGRGVDDGRPRDADLRHDVAGNDVRLGNRGS